MVALGVMFLRVNQIISLVISGSGIRIGSQCFLFNCNLRWRLQLIIVVGISNLTTVLVQAIYWWVVVVQDLMIFDTVKVFVAMHSMLY